MTKKELIDQLRELRSGLQSLESEKEALLKELGRIRKSEHRYRMIFDYSYISIWEEDYSQVYAELEKLKNLGVRDFKAYFVSHPEFVIEIVKKLKVININPTTLKLYNAHSKDQLLGSLDRIFVPEATPHFIDEMTAIANGARHYEGETVGRKLTGEKLDLLLRITIPESGDSSDYSNVLVGIIDITERKRREEEYLRMLQIAESLRTTTMALTSTMDRDKILDIILNESRKTVPYTAVTVGLLKNDFVEIVRHHGIEPFYTTIAQMQYIYNHPDTLSIQQLKKTHQPILISDTRGNPGWRQFESTTWVRSYLAMPIKVRNQTIGLVSFYGKEAEMFSENTIRIMDPFVLSAGVALENSRLFLEIQKELIEKKQVEKIIRTSLEEKKILLMEIHHRVKNNLNIVASLLNLQAEQIQTVEQAKIALKVSQNRVHSMSMVHENLYQSEDLANIDIGVYIRRMAKELVNIYTTDTQIDLSFEAEKIYLTVNQAVPLGLLLNELITNTITHAFPGRSRGKLTITMRQENERGYVLTVADDGTGIPAGLDPDNSPSLGLHLVRILAQQLGGDLVINSGKGTHIQLTFPVKEAEEQ